MTSLRLRVPAYAGAGSLCLGGEDLCETNPIWPGRPGMGAGGRETPGERWCETKPISARATGGTSALQKRSYGKSYMQQASAKQSQFFDCGFRKACGPPPGLARAGCTNKPNWIEPIVQNEPNFGELAGAWNTQHSTIPLFQHSSSMPIVRNKANLVQSCRSDGPGLAIVATKTRLG